MTLGGGPAANADAAKSRRQAAGTKLMATKTERETLLVSAPEVREPVAVRYAWKNSPEANLYNGAGLPAVPFRSDNW